MAPYGDGEVMFWNTTSLSDKNSRGLMVQALTMMFPAFVTQQSGIKVVHFDDFPAPVPDNSIPVIEDAYGLSIKDFFSDVWWQDVQQIARDHDLVYTGFMIGSYKATSEEDVDQLVQKIRASMFEYGRGLMQVDGEIGLHGLNHQPLVTNGETMDPELGYTAWASREEMRSAVERIVETFSYYIPKEEIRSYVPPSNIIGASGLSVLNEAFPNGLVIASLYSGDTSKGSYVQEFGPDPIYEHLYNFPRISSGYNETIDDQFVVVDAIANFGLVSHFIHPDDVLDERRSKGQGWATMKDSFEDMFKMIDRTYPHLEALTQYDAYQKYELYQQADIEVAYTEDTIEINSQQMLIPSTMLIRLQAGTYLETGKFSFGNVRPFGDSRTLYQLELKTSYVSLEIKTDRQ
ncbi:DUF2194 domain-containing protein [Exiguobacterium sp. SH5S13]|uniref:DUF2194 domain-containing protein n=1 Tax=Exiguobacterium sp. SH5S13 TaxID=2510959 RepID=UPI001F2F3A18|nr:DUF2194 domain-containing protein [Exiguobacterium sp. SH5S13]